MYTFNMSGVESKQQTTNANTNVTQSHKVTLSLTHTYIATHIHTQHELGGENVGSQQACRRPHQTQRPGQGWLTIQQ